MSTLRYPISSVDPATGLQLQNWIAELTVDTTAPAAPAVTPLTTNATAPTLSGGAALEVRWWCPTCARAVDDRDGSGGSPEAGLVWL